MNYSVAFQQWLADPFTKIVLRRLERELEKAHGDIIAGALTNDLETIRVNGGVVRGIKVSMDVMSKEDSEGE